MGCWDSFCSFCSGPFENPRQAWIFHLEHTAPEDWPDDSKLREWNGHDQIPAHILDEVVTFSERDGQTWEACVCVTPEAPETFVSPPCSVDSYGCIGFEGWGEDLRVGDRNLIIHPVCLAFVCRHNNITPKQLWESFYAETSRYQFLRDDLSNGLLHCIDYFEMRDRAGQGFEYDFPDPERGAKPDPESLEAQWLLSRPTCLPTPRKLQLATTQTPSSSVGIKVFEIPEILDTILDHIIDVPITVIESELKTTYNNFDAPSAITAAKALLSLAQVNRSFYRAVVGNRQGIFLTTIQNFGWMLPFSPADWADNDWPEAVLKDAALVRESQVDWRAYMLDCIGKTTPHIRNRWRLHKMAVQFARGRNGHEFEKNSTCIWNAGSLRFKPDLQKSDAKGWEVGVDWWGGGNTEIW